MNREEILNDIRRGFSITVQKGMWSNKSKCQIKGCQSKQKFLIFSWDGKPMLSRLDLAVCAKHLSNGVELATKNNEKLIQDQFKRRIEQIKTQAEEIKK